MKDLSEIYKDDYGYFGGGYTQLIESTGVTVVDEESDADYQGDTYMLVQEGDRYGWLVFGWGSCSGCDAFQACTSLSDLDRLRHQLYESIDWGTLPEVVAIAKRAPEAGRYYATAPAYLTLVERLDARLAQTASGA